MPRTHALSRADFVYVRGFKRLQGDYFSLQYGEIPGRKLAGGACVVSSKTAPRAVDRNRIKRRARSIIRDILPLASGHIIMYYAKKPAALASYADIATDMKALYRRAFASAK